MNTMAPDERRRRAPWGALGMLGLVIAVEAYVSRHDLDYLHWSNWAWRLSTRAAAKDANDCAVLCFGDSLVKYSIVPRILQEQTGKRAYNLALASAQPPGDFFLLRRALAAGGTPLGDRRRLSALAAQRPSDRQQDPLRGAEQPPGLPGPGLAARDPGFFADTFTRRILESYKDRWEIREAHHQGPARRVQQPAGGERLADAPTGP